MLSLVEFQKFAFCFWTSRASLNPFFFKLKFSGSEVSGSEFTGFLLLRCVIDATAIIGKRQISCSFLADAYEQYRFKSFVFNSGCLSFRDATWDRAQSTKLIVIQIVTDINRVDYLLSQ